MAIRQGGEVWESSAGELTLSRTIEATDDGETLVTVTLHNSGARPLAFRVIEDVPNAVRNAQLITAAGGDPKAWCRVGDWIVHEAVVPPETRRVTTYLLESNDHGLVSLRPPRIRSVKPVEEEDESTASAESDLTARTAIESALRRGPDTSDGIGMPTDEPELDVVIEPGSTDAGASKEPSDPSTGEAHRDSSGERESTESEQQGPSADRTAEADAVPDGEHLVEALLTALDEHATEEQERELREAVGITESERARIDYVRSRLDDLAAYVDALENLVDEHGIDVIEEMQASMDASDERIDVVEQRIDVLDSEIESVRADIRAERHARAREIRSVSRAVDDTGYELDQLEARVDEVESFRERFTDALTADVDSSEEGHSSRLDELESGPRSR